MGQKALPKARNIICDTHFNVVVPSAFDIFVDLWTAGTRSTRKILRGKSPILASHVG